MTNGDRFDRDRIERARRRRSRSRLHKAVAALCVAAVVAVGAAWGLGAFAPQPAHEASFVSFTSVSMVKNVLSGRAVLYERHEICVYYSINLCPVQKTLVFCGFIRYNDRSIYITLHREV